MRVPLSWLQDFVTIEQPVTEVAETLTNAGLEVKTIDYYGVAGADLVWDREKLVLGQILKVEEHPNADRLVLATVAYGGDEPEVVVTGAPNLFPYVGEGELSEQELYSPFALEGATLYDGHKDDGSLMTLKGRKLRGVYNRCMLCSEKELGISEAHEGVIIMEKGPYAPDYQPGVPLQDVLGDAVLEIDIIPNIARCTSMVGVAREYAALTGQKMAYPAYDVVMEGPPVAGKIEIRSENPELNPRFVGVLIEGISQKPSPYWMQYRLRLAGQRPINVAVDVSNYVMLEMGQPNHAFDYDFLRRRADEYAPEGPVQIITRLPHEGETVTTLDGVTHELPPYSILVTDPQGNLSLGGVMGGAESEIKDETEDVLLEAAAWNFINIRRTSSELGIHSDAAFRFSRGVHPSLALKGAKRAAELLRRLAGGTVAQGIIDHYAAPPETNEVKLDLDYARRLSGLDLSGEEMADLLRRLEFEVAVRDDHLLAVTPDHRMDIEGGHDLVEEICRMYGYDRIPSTILADTLPPQRGNPNLEKEERMKDLLVEAGLQEVISFRLSSIDLERKMYLGASEPPQIDEDGYVRLTNPISPERSAMRRNLLASLLEVTAANSRFQERIALFEMGRVYHDTDNGLLPDEVMRLAIVLNGRRQNPHWSEDAPPQYDFFDLKGIVSQLLDGLHVTARYERVEDPTYRPGRAARLCVGDDEIGLLGEVHPLVVQGFGIRAEDNEQVLAADLNVAALSPHIPPYYPYRPLSPYPAINEDLALVVDKNLPEAAVAEALYDAGGFLLKRVALFDVYEGEQIPADKKSLAYHLTFQSPSKTLQDREVSKQRQRILKKLEKKIGAQLR